MSAPRVGVVMWPTQSWPQAGEQWRRAEELGFDTAWVYDHTAWRGHTPWYDAYTTLAAAAATTSRIRLGTLVTSPNLRHPVLAAHAAKTIDHISGGRLTLGVGAGGANRTSDGDILGGPELTPRQRADRYAEWTTLLDRILRGPETSFEGEYYEVREAFTGPGCVQRPRVPIYVAGTGPRGVALAARVGDGWIIDSGAAVNKGGDLAAVVRDKVALLERSCEREDRDPRDVRRLLLTGFNDEPWLESPQTFADLAGRYGALGITDIAVHWPRPGTPWAADESVFEAIGPGLA
ncbi:LLM class flavin-dependent oxidoreductase [Actinomadura parmotrematis]|uniref:LLM class flavin-dependent oxidoreductase n=1 Tax=Actinomadura parmotrematis TaxID=2864039 RepID=A0ABS7G332_9ACTN|nr:LLM class flavin-dependent oxidoreductase [Actinomadura parmotrematis]MBW8487123.1 LLM class flavin-dependent oxidoreductase [Actinomadura parmotrematis]